MRSRCIAVALFSSAVLLGGAGAARAEGEVSAKVNGMAISQARLDGTFGAFLESQRVSASALRHPKDYQDLRRKILDTLVAQELLAQEAQKRG
ncbi:MAG: putative PpiC-type peptidyl-prolyl cis-trans isomerase, partial [Acidobacteria bacterium]|nr:putative PpiC-type peptidyl-prolyl cis-trans isomerase [Acidobacteriota bacterium]